MAPALGHWSGISGSVLQLLVNLAGMAVAGLVTLLVQRVVWDIIQKRQTRERPTTTSG